MSNRYLTEPLKQVVIKATPSRAKPKLPSKTITGIHFSDIHFPYHHPAALALLYSFITALKPQVICDHGDTMDAYSISKYEKDPNHRTTLAAELQLTAQHFAHIEAIAPNADLHWLEGNHEHRLKRLIWRAATTRELREVLTLPEVQEAIKLPKLLGIEGRWRCKGYGEVGELYNGKLLVTHGNVARKAAGASAKAELETHGKSGMSGHCHRTGSYRNRDYSGSRIWHELGCLCSLTPHYGSSLPDWHLGFAVVTYHLAQDAFHVEPVMIEETFDGGVMGLFRGDIFQAHPRDLIGSGIDLQQEF